MFGRLRHFLAGAMLSTLGVVAAIAPAHANASFGFDLALTGGDTAIGQVTISMSNPLNFIASYNVVTSGASGYLYKTGLGLPSPAFADGNLYVTFNRPGYNGFLQLEFSAPVNANGTYVLNMAGSFECIGGYQSAHITDNTCSHGTERSVVSTESDPADVVVPEPASLALLGTGLLLFAATMRRRRKSTSQL